MNLSRRLLRIGRRALGTADIHQILFGIGHQLDVLHASLGATAAAAAAIEGRLLDATARLGSDVADLNRRLETQEGLLVSADGRLTGVEERLAGVEERLAGVEERLATIDRQMAAIEIRLVDAAAATGNQLDRVEESINTFRAMYIGGNRVLVRFRYIPLVFIAESNDRIIVPRLIRDGVYEIEVTKWLLANVAPDEVCLDVGANIGYHACIMARLARSGVVIAAEPDPNTFALLVENMNVNWLEAVIRPELLAISDHAGELTLHRVRNRSSNTSAAALTEDSALGMLPGETFNAPCATVEAVVQRYGGRLDLLKIDVEGHEPAVLRGLGNTLKANLQLRILMEWSPAQLVQGGSSPEALLDEIAAQGLVVHRLLLDGTEEPTASREKMISCPYWNVVLRAA